MKRVVEITSWVAVASLVLASASTAAGGRERVRLMRRRMMKFNEGDKTLITTPGALAQSADDTVGWGEDASDAVGFGGEVDATDPASADSADEVGWSDSGFVAADWCAGSSPTSCMKRYG